MRFFTLTTAALGLTLAVSSVNAGPTDALTGGLTKGGVPGLEALCGAVAAAQGTAEGATKALPIPDGPWGQVVAAALSTCPKHGAPAAGKAPGGAPVPPAAGGNTANQAAGAAGNTANSAGAPPPPAKRSFLRRSASRAY